MNDDDALLQRMKAELARVSGLALANAGETVETVRTVEYQWDGDFVVISAKGREVGRVHVLALAAERPPDLKAN